MFSAGFTEDLPICSICQEPVKLETAKTDEGGKAVHEDCYLAGVRRSDASLMQRQS